jgi:hypothetical protein
MLIMHKMRKCGKASVPSQIIGVRPCSLVGAALFLKQEYVREVKMRQDQNLILTDAITGEISLAPAFGPLVGPRKSRSYSRSAIEKNRQRRKKYYESRDRLKKAKIPIEV